MIFENLNSPEEVSSTERFLAYQFQFEEALKSIKTDSFLVKFLHAKKLIIDSLSNNKMIAIAGNGGSNADAMHFSAELINQFKYPHRPLPVLALGTNQPVVTSWANDQSFSDQFTREMLAYKEFLGLIICITTSGKSENIQKLIKSAKENNIPVLALTGKTGSEHLLGCEEILVVNSAVTSTVQEVHTIIYHALCIEVELEFKS